MKYLKLIYCLPVIIILLFALIWSSLEAGKVYNVDIFYNGVVIKEVTVSAGSPQQALLEVKQSLTERLQ